MVNLKEKVREMCMSFAADSGADNAFQAEANRDAVIIRTSVLGILANVFLAGFKAAVGVISGSIAIIMDAVNNLSDAASSLITIIGTKLAAKEPDREHPFGHGRVEYLSAMVIAVLVLYAGITSLTESVKKILWPVIPDYSAPSLVIIAAAVLVKIFLGRYVQAVGEKVRSDSLVNSGRDAVLDSVISASTLAAAFLFIIADISVEAWLGAAISLVIIKSGVDMLRDTLSRILGQRADAELAENIKKTVLSFPEVSGAYDLVLNDYGPDTYNGSIHIEVPDTCTAVELDELIRAITLKVLREHHVILTAIGVYSLNTSSETASRMRSRIEEAVMARDEVLQMHGFYLNEEKKAARFDVVISFDAGDRRAAYREICREVQALYPGYRFEITMDTDFTG